MKCRPSAEAIAQGWLAKESINTPAELKVFVDPSRILGVGEAACLALAQAREWLVASDERRTFFREARSRLGEGRILNTAGIYVLAIRAGLLTVEDANAAKATLKSGPGFGEV